MFHQAKKRVLAGVLIAGSLLVTSAVQSQTPAQIVPLWSGVAPGSESWTQKEVSYDLTDSRFTPPNPDTLVWNVTNPTLAVFKPAPGKANGTAVIVAPGGGFRVLSYKNEGLRVAQWLADHGVTAFVLKYRLNRMPDDPAEVMKGLEQMMKAAGAPPPGAAAPNGAPKMPLRGLPLGPIELMGISDGQQAIKLVRSRAKEFGIDPHRIGIIGFSAGGAVAGEATVRAEPADRPNFVGVIYSFVNSEIPTNAPPAFFAGAADDPLAVSMPELFTRWRASGAPAELHIYAKGQHGFGTAKQGLPVDNWLDGFHAWMRQQGFVASK